MTGTFGDCFSDSSFPFGCRTPDLQPLKLVQRIAVNSP